MFIILATDTTSEFQLFSFGHFVHKISLPCSLCRRLRRKTEKRRNLGPFDFDWQSVTELVGPSPPTGTESVKKRSCSGSKFPSTKKRGNVKRRKTSVFLPRHPSPLPDQGLPSRLHGTPTHGDGVPKDNPVSLPQETTTTQKTILFDNESVTGPYLSCVGSTSRR